MYVYGIGPQLFKVYYKNGLGAPTAVAAEDESTAFKSGIAYYRFTSGADENLDFLPTSEVIDHIEYIGENK